MIAVVDGTLGQCSSTTRLLQLLKLLVLVYTLIHTQHGIEMFQRKTESKNHTLFFIHVS